jgi:hypothetical protein
MRLSQKTHFEQVRLDLIKRLIEERVEKEMKQTPEDSKTGEQPLDGRDRDHAS